MTGPNSEEELSSPIDSQEPEETPGYKAPTQKSIDEIQALDSDDESLVKYKETLLAGVDPNAAPSDDPRRVIVQQMVLKVDGQDDEIVNLTGDLSSLKDRTISAKEGHEYRIQIDFKIQHEIVSGLRYHHSVSRKGITVDKQSYMVGSYPPKADPHEYTCPPDEFPKGMMARGLYKVKSKLIDDDKNVHLEWEWTFEVGKA